MSAAGGVEVEVEVGGPGADCANCDIKQTAQADANVLSPPALLPAISS